MIITLLNVRPVFGAPPAQATIAPSIFIQSPRQGQALQGVEIIEGKIRGEGLLEGKISFSYARTEGEETTWFFIADVFPSAEDSSQASFKVDWDTSLITDGDYKLRVIARYRDGSSIFELVSGLRVRNYSPVETPTPGLVQPGESPGAAPVETHPATIESTPVALPVNPLVIQSENLRRTLIASGIGVGMLFAAGGIYWLIKYRSGH
jgi:hypothetical protein